MSKLTTWVEPIGNSVLVILLAVFPIAAIGFLAPSL